MVPHCETESSSDYVCVWRRNTYLALFRAAPLINSVNLKIKKIKKERTRNIHSLQRRREEGGLMKKSHGPSKEREGGARAFQDI